MSSVDVLAPDLPESVADATVGVWHKQPGDQVHRDEVLVEIETDKVVLEVPANETGILKEIIEKSGAIVLPKQILGRILPIDSDDPVTSKKKVISPKSSFFQGKESNLGDKKNDLKSPIIRRLIAEHNLDEAVIKGSGEGSRITRKDVEDYLAIGHKTDEQTTETEEKLHLCDRYERRAPMSRLRQRIAERLLEAKNSTAMLTTFNEINMQAIMNLRKEYGEAFENRHGVRLGLMSFYIKAVVEALKRFPEVNASIDNFDVVYHNYFDISIAVSTTRGLVTPVLRDADTMGMADIENKIKELAVKGREGKLTVEELTGGNFTITNGGVFGSLMSTPIINPPQSAILGMHAIKDRPMAVNGQVVIQPMMYLALSYDHRLIDGKESVNYLLTIKNILEDPIRLLLDI